MSEHKEAASFADVMREFSGPRDRASREFTRLFARGMKKRFLGDERTALDYMEQAIDVIRKSGGDLEAAEHEAWAFFEQAAEERAR